MKLGLAVALFAVSAVSVSAVTGLLAAGPQVSQSAAPDLILVGGRVYTLDPARPWAEAVAVRGDRIVGVGTSAEMRQAAGASTRVIDLNGGFVTPGFNDGHVHIESTGALLTGANLLDVHEPKAFRERIAEAASRLPAGSWITRGDWGAYEKWGQGSAGAPVTAGASATAEGAAGGPFMPDRRLIDDVTPNHPVLVNRFDQSAFLANTLALKQAGVADETPNPAGGEFVRDANGRMTGVLRGSAVEIVRKAVTPISFEQRLTQVRAVLREAREGGVTTIQDLTSGPQLRAYQYLHARGELDVRILLRPTLDMVAHVEPLGITGGFGDHWLKYIGYKAWVDGIMGGSTAMFFEPYSNNARNKGTLRPIMRPEGRDGAADGMTPAQRYTDAPPGNMEKLLVQAARSGLTPHVHAIGDKAVRILLDIYERVLTGEKLLGTDHRWRVIHAQVLYPGDAARFGKLGLVAEVNPYHISDDMRWMEERIGAERSRGAYAFRTLKNAGAVLVFGSDSPGTNAARYFLNPVYGLYAATSRQTLTGEPRGGWFPDERLTIEEAIEAATKNPAWASFEEQIKGTITVGKLADLAVFDTNLVEVGRTEPARLLKARVLYTIAGGKVVYERRDASKRMPDGRQWMTDNLSVHIDQSYCYGDAEANCRRYGRLYTWESARRGCQSLGDGWRLPTADDWWQLAKHYGGVFEDKGPNGKEAYKALLSGGSSGFNALLAGNRESDSDQYARLEAHGVYWTASERDPASAVFYNFGKGSQTLYQQRGGKKQMAISVRCVKD